MNSDNVHRITKSNIFELIKCMLMLLSLPLAGQKPTRAQDECLIEMTLIAKMQQDHQSPHLISLSPYLLISDENKPPFQTR